MENELPGSGNYVGHIERVTCWLFCGLFYNTVSIWIIDCTMVGRYMCAKNGNSLKNNNRTWPNPGTIPEFAWRGQENPQRNLNNQPK
jgi:hypothetical protein